MRPVAGAALLLSASLASLASLAGAQVPTRAVLVTGASSGIGRKVTERLASNGYFVYAGARSQKDLDELNAIRNVQALRLDVTSQTDIAAAVQTVTKAGRGLYGVVNNAGVLVIAPLIEADEKELDYIFGVNLYGPYRITKAFAPLVIESRGRVINISSLNGIVAQPIIGAYSMSKHGVEAYGDALAGELSRFGVRVSLIEPGNYGTDIGRNTVAHTDTSKWAQSRFAQQLRNTLNNMRSFENNPPPDDVADAVLASLNSTNPKARYLVVPAQGQADVALRKLFSEIAELNAGHKFTRDRDALVRMLDDALARAKPD
jgi:NAD(P)-dependent dehydrogenase (short-subunit alcohol dehydrogenase family)